MALAHLMGNASGPEEQPPLLNVPTGCQGPQKPAPSPSGQQDRGPLGRPAVTAGAAEFGGAGSAEASAAAGAVTPTAMLTGVAAAGAGGATAAEESGKADAIAAAEAATAAGTEAAAEAAGEAESPPLPTPATAEPSWLELRYRAFFGSEGETTVGAQGRVTTY